MKRCVTIFLIFMVVTVLFAGKVNDRIEKRSNIEEKTYNWESGTTEFVGEIGRDSRSVPNLIDYQGKITDSSSNPITSSVSITFTIYDDATGGTNLWDEIHASVTPVDGLVHVLLGSIDVIGSSLFDGSDRWLGIEIGSDGEMTPRLRIVSVPYAIYANDSDNLDGHDSSYFMTASTDYWVSRTGDTMSGELEVFPYNGVAVHAMSQSSGNYGCLGTPVNGVTGFSTNGSAGYFTSTYDDFLDITHVIHAEYTGSGEHNNPVSVYGVIYPTGNNSYYGVYGDVCGGYGTNYGIYGNAYGGDGTNYGIYGNAYGGSTNYAGWFEGDVVINGDLQIEYALHDSDSQPGTSGQVLSSTGSGTDWITVSTGSGDGHSLDAADGSPVDVVYVDNDGKVGIGTTTPNKKLDVDGDINISTGKSYDINSYPVVSTAGSYNTFLGYRAGGTLNDDTGYNLLVGYQSGWNCTGGNNVFLGYRSGYQEGGSNKLYIENSWNTSPLIYGEFDNDYVKINGNFEVTGTLYDDDHDAGTSGQVLSSTGTGTDWVDNPGATEIDDLTNGKTGGYSVFLGQSAGNADDGSNHFNTGIGYGTLQAVTGGSNTAMGYFSAKSTTGSSNTSMGAYSLYHNTTGQSNVAIGRNSINWSSTGSNNTAIGYDAGYGSNGNNITGNTFIGYNAGFSAAGSYNIFIGNRAGENEAGSSKLYIENSNSTSPLIGGDFSTNKVTINDVLILAPRSTAPTAPTNGEIYVGTDNHIYCYLGGSWKQLD